MASIERATLVANGFVELRDTGNALSNTNQFNNAVSDLTAMGGGTIFINAGTYEVTHSSGNDMVNLRVAKNLTIIGRGKDATTVLWDEGVYPVVQGQDRYMFSTSPQTSNITFTDFSVNGKFHEIDEAGNWINGAQFHVFNVYGSSKITLHNLHLYNCLADAIRIIGSGVKDITVSNNHIEDCGRSGVSFQGGSRIRILNNTFLPPISDQAIDAESSALKDDVIIDGNHIESGTGGYTFAPICRGNSFRITNNVIIGDTIFHSSSNLVVSGNTFNKPDEPYVLSLLSGKGFLFTDNVLHVAGRDNPAIYGRGLFGDAKFSDNVIYDYGPTPTISFDDCSDLLVSNNYLVNKGGTPHIAIGWVGIRSNIPHSIISIRDNNMKGYTMGINFSAKAIWKNSPIKVLNITNNVSPDSTVVVMSPLITAMTTTYHNEGNLS